MPQNFVPHRLRRTIAVELSQPQTGEPPWWYLPDGRPVHRQALIKKWEARGRPAIPLDRVTRVVDLAAWLAQDDQPIPPAAKWGMWRLDLRELAKVVDFLEAAR